MDAEYKGRFKNYTDAHRKATHLDISVGEFVLTKKWAAGQNGDSVVDRNGPRVILETTEGRNFDRNVSEIKTYCQSPSVVGKEVNQRSSITVENVPTGLPAEETATEPSIVYSDVPNANQRQSDHVGESRRSDRVPKRAKYLEDYVSFG